MALTNPYVKFAKMVKIDLQIGEILSIDATNGTSTVEDPNGYTFVALGTSVSVGTNAYVKDGVIQSAAPSLSASEVLV